jgi:hypothetical protein
MWASLDPEVCDQYGTGRLITYADRDRILTLADRLDEFRGRQSS